jgi:hypothetical protein
MSRAIELSDESLAWLKHQAESHGVSVDAWVEMLARERANVDAVRPNQQRARAAAARILEIQKRVKPDPEGWAIRDYIDYGRA